MAINAETAIELIRKLNAERDECINSLNKTTELLTQLIASSGNVVHPLPQLTSDNVRRNTLHTRPTQPEVTSVGQGAGSTFSDDEDSSSDDGVSLYVQTPLEKEQYTIEGLREHIRTYKWSRHSRKIVAELLKDDTTLQRPSFVPYG